MLRSNANICNLNSLFRWTISILIPKENWQGTKMRRLQGQIERGKWILSFYSRKLYRCPTFNYFGHTGHYAHQSLHYGHYCGMMVCTSLNRGGIVIFMPTMHVTVSTRLALEKTDSTWWLLVPILLLSMPPVSKLSRRSWCENAHDPIFCERGDWWGRGYE